MESSGPGPVRDFPSEGRRTMTRDLVPPHFSYSSLNSYMQCGQDKFWAKVDMNPHHCWEWQGSTRGNGYGQVAFGAAGKPGHKVMYAHRVAYVLTKGDIPAGLVVDHLCRNRACVNPEHLELVTLAENTKRAVPFWPSRRPTHCKHGHGLTEENAGVRQNGERWCRVCQRGRNARAKA